MSGNYLKGLVGAAILALAMAVGTWPAVAGGAVPRKPFAGAVPPVQSDLYDPFWSLVPQYESPYLFNNFLSRQLAYPGPYWGDYAGPVLPPAERLYVFPGPYGTPPYQDYGHYYPYYGDYPYSSYAWQHNHSNTANPESPYYQPGYNPFDPYAQSPG